MTDEMLAWIDEHYPTQESAYGKCAEATEAMMAAFPGQLRRVRGWVEDLGWGRRAHWWCVNAEGEIVDPTRRQFTFLHMYEPHDESTGDPPEPRVCMNCGVEHFGPFDLCSHKCEQSYLAYLNGGSL